MIPDSLRPVVAITQARVGSSRLPAKVLRPMAGKPMLEWHLLRLKQAKTLDAIVVATTHEQRSDEIEAIARRLGVAVFRGPEQDVLARYHGAARLTDAQTIVRVTSDCPLIDPRLIDELVAFYALETARSAYAALDVERYPRGLDCEIFSRAACDEAARKALLPADREHVTRYIRRRERFEPRYLSPGRRVKPHRWCVDTPEDFRLIETVLGEAGERALALGWKDIAQMIEAHETWGGINAHVAQKAD